MFTAPKPAFTSLVEQKEPINNNYTEIRVSKEKGEKVDVGTLAHVFFFFFAITIQVNQLTLTYDLPFLQWSRNQYHRQRRSPRI